MITEEKDYIETKSLGTMRVVHVDMSQRMRQNAVTKKRIPIERQEVRDENDEINALLQQIQDKRDAILMESKLTKKYFVKENTRNPYPDIPDEIDDKEDVPAFKRNFVIGNEDIPTNMVVEEQFDWAVEENWEVPSHETIPKQERYEQHVQNEMLSEEIAFEDKDAYIENSQRDMLEVNPYGMEANNNYVDAIEEQPTYMEQMHTVEQEELKEETVVEEEHSESSKFIFYTILILIVDILLILLLHSKASFFAPSNLKDTSFYFCIFIKYAIFLHLLITLYTVYKDRKKKIGNGARTYERNRQQPNVRGRTSKPTEDN